MSAENSNFYREGYNDGKHWYATNGFFDRRNYYQALPDLVRIGQPWPDDDSVRDVNRFADEFEDWSDKTAQEYWRGFVRGFLDCVEASRSRKRQKELQIG